MISEMENSNIAAMFRKRFGEDNSSPIDIFALASTIENITVTFYPLGDKISGACYKSRTSVVIAINSSMSLGRQRFSMAHELYHVYYDKNMSSTICANKIGIGNTTEKTADQFASYLLIPQAALYESIQKIRSNGAGKLSVKDVIALEQYFGVSRQAMLYRLQAEKELTFDEAAEMQKDVIRTAAVFGYDTSLYKPSPANNNKKSYGYYVKQAEKLLTAGIISMGKYEELLLDAFRDDIVFGDDEGGRFID